ncbi:MAG: PQQ-binding-like beta-propeller repeat protein [Polyangiales bacterium]
MKTRSWLTLAALLAASVACDAAPLDEHTAVPAAQVVAARATWLNGGNGLDNTHHQKAERAIGVESVKGLKLKWEFRAGGDLWGAPAIDETGVYFGDNAGNLYALDRETGKQRWTRKVNAYTGAQASDYARVTPAIAGDTLIFGNQAGRVTMEGGTVFAVDKKTGNKLWSTKIDTHQTAIVTSAPVVHEGRVYVGVSSWEEGHAPLPYTCCSFRGSMVALDLATGRQIWKTYTVPEGYTGAPIWGSTPVVDVARKTLYATTGNNYSVPKAIHDCNALPRQEVEACMMEVPGFQDNHVDAIVAFDMETGKIRWAHHTTLFDPSNGACFLGLLAGPECPQPYGKDTDFGQGAMLFRAGARELVAAGQKSGDFWALDPDTGKLVWKTVVGPGGLYGGMQWGSATDGARIYTSVVNSDGIPWSLPSGESTRTGFWAALDAATGEIAWQTRGNPAVPGAVRAGVTIANGVMFGGSFDAGGTMYALDAATGATLWSFRSGGSVGTAPVIADGTVYWAAGYGSLGMGGSAGLRKLFAFSVSGGSALPTQPTAPPTQPTGPVDTRTWSGIVATYFGATTMGRCANCHAEMSDPKGAYAFLTARGHLDGTRSRLVLKPGSPLSWFGGPMPPGGPASWPEAERDLKAWVAAGAKND